MTSPSGNVPLDLYVRQEWSSSFQQVLQCGLRRVMPVDHFQLHMIHHATDKAQKRRLRRVKRLLLLLLLLLR